MTDEILKIKDMRKPEITERTKYSIVEPEFYDVKGCVFINNNGEKITEENVERVQEYDEYQTEYEHGRNECRIIDYFGDIGYKQQLYLALEILEIWSQKLHQQFLNEEFHIIISADVDEDVIIYFHKLHDGEDTWLDEDNLEMYKLNAILVNIVEADKDEDDEIESEDED